MVKAKEQTNAGEKKLFADQFDDEDVLFVFRKHPVVMRKGLIFGMLAILLGTLPALVKPELSYFYGGLAAGVVLGAIVYFPSWVNWYFSIFVLTNQRLIQITQKGLFHKTVVDLSLSQIQSLNYEVAGLQATLLGFGTIMVQTYMGDLVVHDIHHPAHIVQKIALVLRDQGIEPEILNGPSVAKDKDSKE